MIISFFFVCTKPNRTKPPKTQLKKRTTKKRRTISIRSVLNGSNNTRCNHIVKNAQPPNCFDTVNKCDTFVGVKVALLLLFADVDNVVAVVRAMIVFVFPYGINSDDLLSFFPSSLLSFLHARATSTTYSIFEFPCRWCECVTRA